MDQIEPILPTPPAISPIDTARVKVRGPKRDDPADRRRGGQPGAGSGGQSSAGEDEEGGEDGKRHVDVRA